MLRLPVLSSLLVLLALAPWAGAQDAPAPREQVVGRNAELRGAFVDLARSTSRHVVRVEEGGRARGYGVILDGGWVLTAAQVVQGRGALGASGPAGKLQVSLHARDEGNDLALLRVAGAAPAGVPLGRTADLTVGQFLVVVGTDAEPIAVGVLSAKDRAVEPSAQERNILMGLLADGNEGHKRAYPRVLQHDGPTSAEVFGAPVVDRAGRLVGISVAAPYRGSSHAVDVDHIASVLEALKAGRAGAAAPAPAQARPWLGVSCVDASPEQRGAAGFGLLVREAQGPAAQAGLAADDVIVALDGQALSSMDAFAREVGQRRPGEQVTLRVLRGGQPVDVKVTLGQRP
ncbi:MAG: S1C family serine protease [Planctomycetes bacterium]|nr:S1C family serine protease [Planctomycetota bacterium]